jgi:hypothetical protein
MGGKFKERLINFVYILKELKEFVKG